jgi:hypothetical protein
MQLDTGTALELDVFSTITVCLLSIPDKLKITVRPPPILDGFILSPIIPTAKFTTKIIAFLSNIQPERHLAKILDPKPVYRTSVVILRLEVTHIKPQRKPIKRNHVLHPIEKLVLQNLLESDPQTINKTATAINKRYKSTFRAFKTMKTKGLIKKTTFWEHRGRKYSQYSLTDLGILKARIDGADPKLVWQKAKENYPENKLFLCILRTAEITGIEPYNIAYSALLTKRKLEATDEGAIIVSQLVREQSPEKFIQLCTILEEEFYEVYQQVEKNLAHVGISLPEVRKKMLGMMRGENQP